jgi:hypothetical protein
MLKSELDTSRDHAIIWQRVSMFIYMIKIKKTMAPK